MQTMRIQQREHYFYAVANWYIAAGWHWLMPLNEFRMNFQKSGETDFVEQVRLEKLLADMVQIPLEEGMNDISDPVGYVFFIPDSYSPKFGVIWETGDRTIIVSPFPLPNIADHIAREIEYGIYDEDEVRMLGPIELPRKED